MKKFAIIFAALFNSILAICQTDLNVLTGSSGNIQTNIDAIHSGRVSFSITEYGAVDGADSTAAIQLAVDSAAAMKRNVFIPLGRFKVSTAISVPSGVLLSGTGSGSVIQVTSGTISAFNITGVSGVTFENFAISGYSNNTASASSVGNGIYLSGSASNTKLVGLHISKFNAGIQIYGADNTLVSGCNFFQNARSGINSGGSSTYIRVDDCLFDGDRTGIGNGSLGQLGLFIQDPTDFVTVQGCEIRNLDDEGIGNKARYFSFIGNVIHNTGNGINCETDLLAVGDSDDGSFGTIKGNTISYVDGLGVYTGNALGVNDSPVHNINISGNNISHTKYGIGVQSLNASADSLRPYAITVAGNILDSVTNASIYLNADSCVVSENIIRNCLAEGIQIYRANNNVINGNHIFNSGGSGISLFTGGSNNIVSANNVIIGGTLVANSDGIRVQSQSYTKVSDNFIFGSAFRYGAYDEATSSFTQWTGNRIVGSYVSTAFNFSGTSSTRVNFNSTTFSVNDSNNQIGVNTQSPGTTAGGQKAVVDIVGRNVKWGGDTDTTRTDDTSKVARWMVPPYDTTPGVDILAMKVDGAGANNDVSIGGGSSVGYAATRLFFFTAANNSTTTGTEVMRLDAAQNVGIGTLASAGAKLEVAGNVLVANSYGYQVRNSGGSVATILTFSDGTGTQLGNANGADGVVIRPGPTSSGITLGLIGGSTPVTLPRQATATSATNLVSSTQLKFSTSLWDGATAQTKAISMVGVPTATNGLAYNLSFKDNSGNDLVTISSDTTTKFFGDAVIGVVGKGLQIREGSNATMGAAILVGGTVTVSTTKVTANSRIFLTPQTLGTVTRPAAVGVTARTASTSFTITSSDATDTSIVAWEIIEPAP